MKQVQQVLTPGPVLTRFTKFSVTSMITYWPTTLLLHYQKLQFSFLDHDDTMIPTLRAQSITGFPCLLSTTLTFKHINQENKVHCVAFFFELCHKLRLDQNSL